MLRELGGVRQIKGEGFRRWFSDEFFDLIVWYEDETQAEAGNPSGFQLCYDKTTDEKALTWHRSGRLSYELVDTGESPGHCKMTPVLRVGGELRESLIQRFREHSLNVDLIIVTLVCTTLEEYVLKQREETSDRTVRDSRHPPKTMAAGHAARERENAETGGQ